MTNTNGDSRITNIDMDQLLVPALGTPAIIISALEGRSRSFPASCKNEQIPKNPKISENIN
jgi:hypothetical protein